MTLNKGTPIRYTADSLGILSDDERRFVDEVVGAGDLGAYVGPHPNIENWHVTRVTCADGESRVVPVGEGQFEEVEVGKIYFGSFPGPPSPLAMHVVEVSEPFSSRTGAGASAGRRLLEHHVRHSPDGFSWGYAGSGPAELARSILWDLLGSEPHPACYQALKADVIARIGQEDSWAIADASLELWLADWRRSHPNSRATLAELEADLNTPRCPKCLAPIDEHTAAEAKACVEAGAVDPRYPTAGNSGRPE